MQGRKQQRPYNYLDGNKLNAESSYLKRFSCEHHKKLTITIPIIRLWFYIKAGDRPLRQEHTQILHGLSPIGLTTGYLDFSFRTNKPKQVKVFSVNKANSGRVARRHS